MHPSESVPEFMTESQGLLQKIKHPFFHCRAGSCSADPTYAGLIKWLYQNNLFQTLRVSGQKNCTGYFFANPKVISENKYPVSVHRHRAKAGSF